MIKEIYKGMSEEQLIEIILNFRNNYSDLMEQIKQKDQRIAELEEEVKRWKDYPKLGTYEIKPMFSCEEVLKFQTALAIEKLEELLKCVDKESDGDQKYPAPILIDKTNSMIKSLKGEK